MDKVYVVRVFDGDSSHISKIYASKDKAEKYAKEYEIDMDETFGYHDSCYVDEYEVEK